jgi:hypothetical protein
MDNNFKLIEYKKIMNTQVNPKLKEQLSLDPLTATDEDLSSLKEKLNDLGLSLIVSKSCDDFRTFRITIYNAQGEILTDLTHSHQMLGVWTAAWITIYAKSFVSKVE